MAVPNLLKLFKIAVLSPLKRLFQREAIQKPNYDRSKVKTGIVHIGPGAFFRGHEAVYIDDVLNSGDLRWGICAVDLRSRERRDALQKQDYLYSVVSQFHDRDSVRMIGSITNFLVGAENPRAVIDQMADPDVKLVTLTVTQKGYYYDSKSGQFHFNHPDIKKELEEATDPVSTVGYIVAALDKRRLDGIKPFTVMSCDNLPSNGDVLRSAVLAYAGRKSQELQHWIAGNVAFPNTMVDRIVPALTQEHLDKIAAQGVSDAWPIYTEPFRQWIIEGEFCNDMPDLEKAGAAIVSDVIPYELMKIRILNGSHMALGPIGFLAGHIFGNEALKDPSIKKFIEGFMEDVTPTLQPVPGIDIEEYKKEILNRISQFPDELTRLARNGSQKAPARFLSPLKEAIAKGTPHDHITFAIAAWMHYLKGYDAKGNEFDILDEEGINMDLQERARSGGGDPRELFAVHQIFGPDLQEHRPFVQKIDKWLRAINDRGMMNALREFEESLKDSPHQAATAHPAPQVA